jgi:hypothetical protein
MLDHDREPITVSLYDRVPGTDVCYTDLLEDPTARFETELVGRVALQQEWARLTVFQRCLLRRIVHQSPPEVARTLELIAAEQGSDLAQVVTEYQQALKQLRVILDGTNES